MNNLKIITAGPGAGKTYNLKNEAINCLSNLDRNRFCAVITYTNAATAELRQRISSEIPIPPNIFIGTIHSFLIRFVIEPFGHLLKMVPLEKKYIDNVKSNDHRKKNAVQKKLSDKGVITFDKVLQLSKEIIKTRSIKEALNNRLQFLFVDEYQDSKKNTHDFFLKIIKNTKTSYFIGDKLQYIYGFTNRYNKTNDLSVTSFVNLMNIYPDNIDKIQINYRSSEAIVQFLNNYIETEFEQRSKKGNNSIPIYFINCTKSEAIIDSYNQLKIQHEINKIHCTSIEKKN
ncbi:MAG: ATP-dependent helicase [Calditrichia bacterium]|nr:ATP-dependent helicase [Calditrichia bacterium]